MKKTALYLACILLCIILAACGRPGGSSSGDSAPAESGSPAQSAEDRSTQPQQEEAQSEEKPEQPEEPLQALTPRQAYAQSLELLVEHNILPNGQETGPVVTGDKMDSTFAVADVDGDGREELVLNYVDTFMAGHMGLICEYIPDTGMMRVELTEYPAFTFYDNGCVRAESSHNHTQSMEVWPHGFYRHDAKTDLYEWVGGVSAWSKKDFPEDYPEKADISGTGTVYYVSRGTAYGDDPVDVTVYQQWQEEILGDARQIPLTFLPLDEQNIRQITEQAD